MPYTKLASANPSRDIDFITFACMKVVSSQGLTNYKLYSGAVKPILTYNFTDWPKSVCLRLIVLIQLPGWLSF